VKVENNIDVPEIHMKGLLSVETPMKSKVCDFGIMIKDGRVWICIDGAAFIRFKPLTEAMCKMLEDKI
jgi:hypothetical protein